jgi:hypothetical protein
MSSGNPLRRARNELRAKGLHLTLGHSREIEQLIDATCPGQAHWGVGPQRCRQCEHHGAINSATAKPCDMYRQLMGLTTRGPLVPADALACRYFQPRPTTQSDFGEKHEREAAMEEDH